jgi:peptidoglycan/LPS O-acetylase OafA/YrhL
VETAIRRPSAAKGPGFHAPALDGLRGLAVLGVVLFHLAALEGGDRRGVLGGGWLGVDVFFTLSGYLITSLLLSELGRRGAIDLGAFWRRRVRRLQPAALMTVAGILATARWWAPGGTAASVRREALAAVSGLANWQALWAHHPYAAGANPSAFEHFWSLAVEEQFYLVWPVALTGLAMLWRRRRSSIRLPLLVLSVSGVALSWWLLVRHGLQRGFLGTDARAASILLGAALAAIVPLGPHAVTERRARIATACLWVGLVASALLWSVGDWPPRFPLGLLLPLQGLATVSVLVGVVLAPSSRPATALSWGPLVLLGRVSYGVYLWHWPVFVLLTPRRLGAGWFVTTTVRLAVLAVLVAVSWLAVEGPVRAGLRFPRTRVALPIAVVSVVLLALVAVRAIEPAPAWAQADGSLVHATSAVAPQLAAGAVHPTRVLVVGDSIATSLVSGPTGTLQMGTGHLLDDLAARGIAASAATITGCPVTAVVLVAENGRDDSCITSQQRRLAPAMDEVRPDLVVWYSRQEAYPFLDGDGHITRSAVELRERYAERLRWFRSFGARVLLVAPGRNADGWEWNTPLRRPETMVELEETIDRVAADNSSIVVGVVHMSELLCNGAVVGCPDEMPGGGHFRIDGVHFLGPGADLASSWLATKIAAVDLRS